MKWDRDRGPTRVGGFAAYHCGEPLAHRPSGFNELGARHRPAPFFFWHPSRVGQRPTAKRATAAHVRQHWNYFTGSLTRLRIVRLILSLS
jgi:hypothetical protein